MLLTVTTLNSTYIIDTVAKTWRSTSISTRSAEGTYIKLTTPRVGAPLALVCPPLEEGDFRLIVTSDITAITEEETCSEPCSSS